MKHVAADRCAGTLARGACVPRSGLRSDHGRLPGNLVTGHSGATRSSIDCLLAEARAGLVRLDAVQAAAAMREGALLIDTRPIEQRLRDGAIPGARLVDRNVLEWRLDPTSPHRLPCVTDHDQLVIVICNEGYSSSLAAATLVRLGVRRATDVIDGFQAWAASGLPVEHPRPGLEDVHTARSCGPTPRVDGV